jgi:phosphoserine phosphatase
MHRFLLVRHATPVPRVSESVILSEAKDLASKMGAQDDNREMISDPPLSEVGRIEAMAIAARLAGWQLDAAWSSDLNRAAQTADLIMAGRQSPTIRRSSLLREIDPPSDPAQQLGQPGYRDWERETLAKFSRELSDWLRLATSGPEGEAKESPPNILVVSHAGPLMVLVCLLLGLPVEAHWSFRFDWASLSVVEWAGDLGTLTLLNDRCHLEAI